MLTFLGSKVPNNLTEMKLGWPLEASEGLFRVPALASHMLGYILTFTSVCLH